jgi:hypothetical protein
MIKYINKKQNIFGIIFFILSTPFINAAGSSNPSTAAPGIALQNDIAERGEEIMECALKVFKNFYTFVKEASSGGLAPNLECFSMLIERKLELHIIEAPGSVCLNFRNPLNGITFGSPPLGSLRHQLLNNGYEVTLEANGDQIRFEQKPGSLKIGYINASGVSVWSEEYKEGMPETVDRNLQELMTLHLPELLRTLETEQAIIGHLCTALAGLIKGIRLDQALVKSYIGALESPVLRSLAIDDIAQNGVISGEKDNVHIRLQLGYIEPYCLELQIGDKQIQLEKKLNSTTSGFELTLILKTQREPSEYREILQEQKNIESIVTLCHKLKIATYLANLNTGVGNLYVTRA